MNLDDLSWGHIVSTVLGGGGASILARWIFDKALHHLQDITSRLEGVASRLMVTEIHLKEMRDLVTEHDRKIVSLESRLRSASSKLR